MRKIEIKEVGVKNIFKITTYIICVPLGFMVLLGVLLIILGAAFGNGTMIGIGIPYLVMAIFFIFIYGLINMLVAFVYNKLSSRFGGLELVIVDKSNIETTEHPNQHT